MNRGSMAFDAVIKRAASLGCPRVAFIMSKNGKASEIRFASVDSEWGWLSDIFNVKKYSKLNVMRGNGEVSSKSKKLKGIFGFCDSSFGFNRAISYSKKRISIFENKKEVFWVEGVFSKR